MAYRNGLTRTVELIPAGTVMAAPLVRTFEVEGVEAATFLLKLTGASSNEITVTLESTTKEELDFYSLVNFEDTDGETVVTKKTFSFIMTGTSDNIEIPVNLQYEKLRLTISSTNTSGTVGIKMTRVD